MVGVAFGVARAADAPHRPNVIFILTDDQGWGDAANFGHPYLKTPNIDRLAREGTRYTQFYVASPVCSASRAGFITGQYPARWGVHGHFDSPENNAARGMPNWLDPRAATIARQLQAAGYATAHFGKWHLGHSDDAPAPAAYGFDASATYNSGPKSPQLGEPEVQAYRQAHPDWQAKAQLNEEKMPYFRAHSTEWIVNDTLAFLREHRGQPCYVNVWTLLPHAPLDPTPEQLAVYSDLQPRADDPAFGRWAQEYFAKAKNLRDQMRVFAASVTELDTQIGRLLDGLREMGLADDTIVVFSSDNGPEDYRVGNAANAGVGSPGPFRARKRSLYEGGIRTPLIVRWPGRVAAGKVDTTSIIGAVDYFPTVCALTGAHVPAGLALDGEDVSDILLGHARPRRGPLYWEWRGPVIGAGPYRPPGKPGIAVREGEWKFFAAQDAAKVELYDLPNDPEERTNVAAQHPEVVARFNQLVQTWQATLPPPPPPPPPGSVVGKRIEEN